MSYLLKKFNPVAVGHAICFSAFGFILFEGNTVFNVWSFITGAALAGLGTKYMRHRVKNEAQAQLAPGAKVVHVAYMRENEYLMVAKREDGTSFYLTVNKEGDHCPFDSDALAIKNLRHTGKF